MKHIQNLQPETQVFVQQFLLHQMFLSVFQLASQRLILASQHMESLLIEDLALYFGMSKGLFSARSWN